MENEVNKKWEIDGRKKKKIKRQLDEIIDSLVSEKDKLVFTQLKRLWAISADLEDIKKRIDTL